MIIVDDQEISWSDGMTIADALSALGGHTDCAVVKLDGKLISKPHFETTRVRDGSTIILLPMIAGG